MKAAPNVIAVFVLAAALGAASTAHAGGYDTPVLYSARHQAMGGTAIGYVKDASALFHNPAGLGNVKGTNLIADVSLITGTITAIPDGSIGSGNIDSNLTVAPFFLLGGAHRFNDWFTAGFALYPVASAGAEFEYTNVRTQQEYTDSTTLLFFEASPGVSFNLDKLVSSIPGELSVGVGYRVTFVSLDRKKGPVDDPNILFIESSGMNFAGIRAGLQWKLDNFQLGFNYRMKTTTTTTGDTAKLVTLNLSDPELDFVLPTQLGLGMRYDFSSIPLGIAFDWQYTLNSENTSQDIIATAPDGNETVIGNQVFWSDASTIRLGLEYEVVENIATRVGWVWDEKTSNPRYLTAFGTPPTPTNSATLGAGYDGGPWEVNLAYVRRFGSRTVGPNWERDSVGCIPCSYPGGEYPTADGGTEVLEGEYGIVMDAVYVDFSYDFE